MENGEQHDHVVIQTREMSTTKKWSVGILLTIFIQTSGFIWYASALNSTVAQHTREIAEIKTNQASAAAVIISREDVDTILSGRDQQIKSLEKEISDFKIEMRDSLKRIESKI